MTFYLYFCWFFFFALKLITPGIAQSVVWQASNPWVADSNLAPVLLFVSFVEFCKIWGQMLQDLKFLKSCIGCNYIFQNSFILVNVSRCPIYHFKHTLQMMHAPRELLLPAYLLNLLEMIPAVKYKTNSVPRGHDMCHCMIREYTPCRKCQARF